MKTQIKTSDEKLAGLALNVPFLGKIEFDEDCIAVTDDAEGAKQLAEIVEHISVIKTGKAKKATPAKVETKKEEKVEEKVEEPADEKAEDGSPDIAQTPPDADEDKSTDATDDGPSVDEMVAHVKTLKFKELKVMANDNYPTEDKVWKKLKSTKKLCDYIVGKLQE